MADDEFQCPHCDHEPYSSKGWLDNHIAEKHPEEVAVTEDTPEPEQRPRRTARTPDPPEEPCDNHPDRESVWESDGVTANVVRYCKQCEERYT